MPTSDCRSWSLDEFKCPEHKTKTPRRKPSVVNKAKNRRATLAKEERRKQEQK